MSRHSIRIFRTSWLAFGVACWSGFTMVYLGLAHSKLFLVPVGLVLALGAQFFALLKIRSSLKTLPG
jgi:hypothetical protein